MQNIKFGEQQGEEYKISREIKFSVHTPKNIKFEGI